MHARTITRRRAIALFTIALMAGTATHALAQVVPAPYVEPGKPGDPASWAGTTEFKNQWGLGAINAQYAYALGYTGKGVGLGVFDTGTSNFLHEFDGRFVAVESKGTLNVAMDAAGVPWNIPNPPIHAGDAYDLMGDRTAVGDQHGTEVGGVIAAARNGVDSNAHGMQGVAFGATLVAANGLYVGPNNGSIEAIDAGLFGAALDGFVTNNVRVMNNSWEILPNAWVMDSSGKTKISAAGPLADVIDQYDTDTSKKVFDVMHSAAHDHQMLFMAAAGNGGSTLAPTAFASLPYFQPDMTGYMISVVNLGLAKSTNGAKFPGNTDYVLSNSSTPCAQTRQWCVAAPGSSIVSTGFDIGDYNSANARTLEQALAVTDPTLLTASQKSLLSIYPGSVFDDVNKTWFYPSYKTTNGTSVAAPFVTGEAGIAMQRFPWMTTPQITEAILTTSRYLPDGTAGAAAVNALNGAALTMTQVPNFQTGWGLIDLKSLMNGPAQLLTSETYTLPTGIVDVFSNSITDAWLRYEQKTQDPADETAWQAEIVAKGWQNGLPANASATDSSEYKFQLARAADRKARAADPGDFIKAGPGTLTLTGSNTYSGATEVQAGLLNIDGINKNSRAIVDDGGTLGGSGSSHGLWVKSGGIVAPGHSIGSLYFDDAGIQLDAGSIYRAELGQKGASDQLVTTGTASIDQAKLLLTRESGLTTLTSSELDTILNGGVSQRYTLLTADKGVSGAFDTSLMQASDAFQHLQLNYSTTSVSLLAFQNSGAIAQDGIWPRSAGQITQDEIWPRKVGAITNDPTTWIDTTPAAAVTEPPTPSAEPEPDAPPADNAVIPDVAAPTPPPGKPAIVDVVIERGARFTPSTGDGGIPEPVITSGKGQIGGSHLSLPAKMIKTLTKLAPNKGMFQAYEILTAQQGLEGTFDADDLPKFAFFNLSLNYSENTVTLDVLHRDIGFADIAATPNQATVAAAADRLKPDNIIHDTILYVPTVQEARLDYQYLSGELHGDVAGEVLDDSRIMRDAVLERMAKRVPDTSAFWLKTIGSFGSTASDHNAVKVSRQTDGLMAGADIMLGDSWIVGAAANYEGTPLRTAGMGIASVTSYHLAGYGGGDLLGLSLHLGGAYGHYNAKTTRVVGVPDLAGIEQARYGANQSQAFGELGMPLVFDDTAIEPFAGIAYTDAGMEAFAETGGPASLTARDQSLDRTQSTLGARLSVTYRDNETVFTPNLELAWAHAFSGIRPGMTMAFVSGPASNEFTVSGTSADRDAAVIRVGLDAAIGDGFSVGAGYEGQIGPHAQDHGVRLDIRVNY